MYENFAINYSHGLYLVGALRTAHNKLLPICKTPKHAHTLKIVGIVYVDKRARQLNNETDSWAAQQWPNHDLHNEHVERVMIPKHKHNHTKWTRCATWSVVHIFSSGHAQNHKTNRSASFQSKCYARVKRCLVLWIIFHFGMHNSTGISSISLLMNASSFSFLFTLDTRPRFVQINFITTWLISFTKSTSI